MYNFFKIFNVAHVYMPQCRTLSFVRFWTKQEDEAAPNASAGVYEASSTIYCLDGRLT
ncbi:hypothetical protein MKX03_001988 [Papaver bracteatum]|nr:hypothetical protein MKX03_001988 [Papaver bracteatum]